MGWFPCECCGCNCLTAEELPNISITGMTGGAWTEDECCWSRTFTFNTTQPVTTVCSSAVDDISVEAIIQADIYYTHNPNPKNFTSYQEPPFSLEYCCESGPTKAGTIESKCKYSYQSKLKLSYRRKNIVVKASRQQVTCNGAPECKLVLSVNYYYDWNALMLSDSGADEAITAAAQGTCFEYDATPPKLCNESYGDPFSPSIDCESNLFLPGPSQPVFFTRIKIYDEWPQGSVTFDNTDVLPEGCQVPLCTDDEFNTQACFVANPGSNIPCTCLPGQLVEQTWRPDNTCNGFLSWVVYTCGNPVTADFYSDEVVDNRLCPEFTRTVIQYPTPDGGCGPYTKCSGTTTNVRSVFELSVLTTSDAFFTLGKYCVEGVSPPPTGCYYPGVCNQPGLDVSKFGTGFLDVTSYVYNKTCNSQSRTLCINAPSWIITFA